jgi:hypothetical protein
VDAAACGNIFAFDFLQWRLAHGKLPELTSAVFVNGRYF